MTRSSPMRGLTSAEAAERRARHGPNDLEDRQRRSLLRIAASVATEPMFLLLLVAAALYLVIGDLGEGSMLAVFACMTVGLVILQERRSERALEALRSLAAPTVRVVRDGRVERIAARDLVPGDAFLLGEGERVAADGVLREAASVSVDESILTGESVPVRKVATEAAVDLPGASAGGDDTPVVHAGTLVVGGHGLAEAIATGRRTRMGQIGASLIAIEPPPTPLERELRRLVRWLGLAALALSV